ncbi:MAG: B12-binding domain-containing radical SAM protein [Candidatus Omnitrophica bacterium]|nr:B12-binding domain-containing radical SAM protein [Candidatus Omnitrophota bacterium]
MPKCVFFNASDFSVRSRFSSLGLAYIASYLRKYSSVNDVYIPEGDCFSKIRGIKPDLIGIYSVTQAFPEACSAARLLRSEFKNTPIIIGGYHITALPYDLPDVFDLAVLGEGEETMRELAEVFSVFGFKPDRLSEVPGIAFCDKGRVTVTAARKQIENIDAIPFPARDLLAKSRFPGIITSRGCPYRCVFCSSASFWGKPRYHSAEYVVDEISDLIKNHGAVHISIWDDLFIADRDRLEHICALIDRRKINKKVSFGCALRSNLVTAQLCVLLKKMNVKRVSIGFESGSQRVLDFLKCGSVTVEQHVKAVELCKAYGLYVTGTFMIGNPEETAVDLRKTLGLINQLKLDGGGTITLTAPLPGTGLWDYANKKGLIEENIDYSRIGIMSTDFSKPDKFKGILLSDKINKDEFFNIAQKIQAQANKYYIKGLFCGKNLFSMLNIRFILARPNEARKTLWYIIKSAFGKASIMDRYIFYYKKNHGST